MSLRLEHVTHRFGKQPALQDVSICVEPGECYGFIGHNGAGKTTAMRIMLGLLRPDEGRVFVDGFLAARFPREARARMGALVETTGFHGHWSGRRNLELLDRLAGGRSDLDALLEQVGLDEAGPKPVRAYSQGMRQRLGVAQALLGDPAYVLLDEPTNGLDPDGIREMRELVLRLTREEKRTVFLSSHQLHELSGLCTRVGVLRAGRLVAEERLEHLLARDRYQLSTNRADAARSLLRTLGLDPSDDLTVELGEREPGAVVRELVEAGIEVQAFAPRPPTLEQIYHREAGTLPAPVAVEPAPPRERREPRGAVARMLRHELRRWMGQLTVPFVLLLPALIGIVAVLVRRNQLLEDREKIVGGTLAMASNVNAFEGVGVALETALLFAPFLILGLASQSLAGERAQGTLRNVLLRPLARWQVACGKGLALIAASWASYVLLLLASAAAAAWAFDFTGVTEILPNGKLFALVSADEIRPAFKTALLSPVLPLAAYAGLGFLAGAVARGGTTALALATGLGLLLDYSREVFRSLEPWVPSSYVPSLKDMSFVHHFVDVSRGVSNAAFTYTGQELWVVPLVWTVVTFALATMVLERRDVP